MTVSLRGKWQVEIRHMPPPPTPPPAPPPPPKLQNCKASTRFQSCLSTTTVTWKGPGQATLWSDNYQTFYSSCLMWVLPARLLFPFQGAESCISVPEPPSTVYGSNPYCGSRAERGTRLGQQTACPWPVMRSGMQT